MQCEVCRCSGIRTLTSCGMSPALIVQRPALQPTSSQPLSIDRTAPWILFIQLYGKTTSGLTFHGFIRCWFFSKTGIEAQPRDTPLCLRYRLKANQRPSVLTGGGDINKRVAQPGQGMMDTAREGDPAGKTASQDIAVPCSMYIGHAKRIITKHESLLTGVDGDWARDPQRGWVTRHEQHL